MVQKCLIFFFYRGQSYEEYGVTKFPKVIATIYDSLWRPLGPYPRVVAGDNIKFLLELDSSGMH